MHISRAHDQQVDPSILAIERSFFLFFLLSKDKNERSGRRIDIGFRKISGVPLTNRGADVNYLGKFRGESCANIVKR